MYDPQHQEHTNYGYNTNVQATKTLELNEHNAVKKSTVIASILHLISCM